MNLEKEHPKTSDELPQNKTPCSCSSDPFDGLPAEIRPRTRSFKDDLRKVTCPGCGQVYYTNRKTDTCSKCETKAAQNVLD